MNNKYIIRAVIRPKIHEAINLVESCRHMLIGEPISPEDVSLSDEFEKSYKSLTSLLEVIDKMKPTRNN